MEETLHVRLNPGETKIIGPFAEPLTSYIIGMGNGKPLPKGIQIWRRYEYENESQTWPEHSDRIVIAQNRTKRIYRVSFRKS